MPPRTVALIAAVCVTIGWLLAATLTPPVARLQSLADPARSPAALEEPPLTERLNFRLREVPAAPTLRRNPFSFGSRARTSAPVGEREPAPVDATHAEPAPVPRPPAFDYSLSGIGIAGSVRSAVLTDGAGIHIVKVNDTFAGYTVVEITDESVTLESSTARHTLRFAQ
jgi:hypothetical protein